MSEHETTPDALPDDVNESTGREKGPLEENLKRRSTWIRLVFMALLLGIYMVTRIVFFAVVAFQFLWVLFTAETNKKLTELGQSLATYTYQIMRFLAFNSEDKPFQFDAEWPSGPPGD